MALEDDKKENSENEDISQFSEDSSEKKEKKSVEEEEKDSSSDKDKKASSKGEIKKGNHRNLGLVLDIPLKVTAELGRTRIAVRDLLNMGQGSILELNKLAGEPMEIFVNEKLVAKGEAIVVNEKFGVRLIDIISPLERVEQLK